MPMLHPQRYAVGKGKKTEDIDKIGNVENIDEKVVIRTRPNGLSGIPSPSSKKPLAIRPKPTLPVRRTNTTPSDDLTVAERNKKNQEGHHPVVPAKNLIKPYQAAPKLIKQAVAGSNVASKISKLGSRLPHKIPADKSPKEVKSSKGKAPSPPPRSKKPGVIACSATTDVEVPVEAYSPNGTPLTGNGLGGGSIPQKGFSYVKPGRGALITPSVQRNTKSPSGLKVPSVATDSVKKQNQATDDASVCEPVASDAARDVINSPPVTLSDVEQSESLPRGAKASVKTPQSRPSAAKPTSRLPVKLDPEIPVSPSPQVPPHSNSKRSVSPARRATINGSGGSAGYCRGGKSLKGQQLKAVSIPQVPINPGSKTANDAINHLTHNNSATSLPLPGSVSASDLTSSETSSSNTEDDQSKNKGRKGLFGFARLVSGRSSFRSELAKKSPHKEVAAASSPSNSHHGSVDASIESQPSDDLPPPPSEALLASQFPEQLISDGRRKSLVMDSASNSSSLRSDVITSQSLLPPPTGLTGVLKNGILTKSASSSSILSDSGGSNLSNTPSLKTKKVSFQDDVTVCDANGISTYSNGLRYSDVDYTFDQSLSCDATDHVIGASQWSSSVEQRRFRPATPCADRLGSLQYRPISDDSPRSSSYQSAVAAAIQSISDRFPLPSTYGVPQVHNLVRANNYAARSASPTPLARQDRHDAPHKEDWSPLRRPVSSNSGFDTEEVCGLASNSYATKPAHHSTKEDFVRTRTKDTEPAYVGNHTYSYFETERPPSRNAVSVEEFNPDTAPYYECCEPASRTSWSPATSSAMTQRPLAADNKVDVAERNFSVRQNYSPLRDPVPFEMGQHGAESGSKTRVAAMEEQLANLSGVVESIINNNSNRSLIHDDHHSEQHVERSPRHQHHQQHLTHVATKQQLLALRDTARDLKCQLEALKRLQRSHMEDLHEMVTEKTRGLTSLIASTAGMDRHPLRARRLNVDRDRGKYGLEASETEKQLSDVEAAVEELRNEVVERRCRVNTKEVEALVLQLSQAGRTVARLKGAFPNLSAELRVVASSESEAMLAEKKFIDAEPSRLDEQLKRCKQLTATLFTLKKLANVQEARSKTPVPFNTARPSTPSYVARRSGAELQKDKSRLLADVTRLKVDHERRMESIQEAEVSWTRRRKFTREYDSKKFEKALEIAEKSLKRTDHVSQIEQRRHEHLLALYRNRFVMEDARQGHLSVSDSSSIESLPPPPPPITSRRSIKSTTMTSSISGSSLAPRNRAHRPFTNSDYVDVGRNRSSGSGVNRTVSYSNSLPRPLRHRSPKTPSPDDPSCEGSDHVHGRQTPVHLLERSRSATPQQWKMSRQFTDDFGQMSDHERELYLEQQQIRQAEKTRRLKEQYSKLQMLQRKQRMVERKGVPQRRYKVTGIPKATSIEASAKTSDV